MIKLFLKAFPGMLCCCALHAQVINFDVPGGAGAAPYVGQGAYPDPGNNFWNSVIGNGSTPPTNVLSDGVTPSPITLTSQLGGTFGTQGAQGTPTALQLPYQYNNAIRRTNSLNNVAPGTYNLYLYGINNTGTRGTTFTVSTAAMSPVTRSTYNTPASLSNFVENADYVIFSNVVLSATGAITFTWTANPYVTVAGNNEGDFNALQLVFVSTNTVATNSTQPNFGANVLIFDPTMDMSVIQIQLSALFSLQQNNQFGTNRYACFFKPGQYTGLDVDIGYCMQLLGLGQMPDDVGITGNVHADGVLANNNATVNFWRSCENFANTPTDTATSPLENANTMTWAVSQGTWLRRMHVQGNLNLANTANGAYSSGGFLADSRVDSTVRSITQQQWFSRNDVWVNWSGQVWNMVFVGVSNPPSGSWPGSKFTLITNTPVIAEKPWLFIDTNGNYNVMVPSLTNIPPRGISWNSGPTPGTAIPISQFYLAQAGVDNADSINAALAAGQNLILTPGVYKLTNTVLVTQPDTIVMGLGYATLVPTKGIPAMAISDVDGVKVSGIIFDAGTTASPTLLQVGSGPSVIDHSADPICLYDICSRVGGATKGMTTNCVTIDANNVIGDNLWLWRADHGTGVGWTNNPSNSGLVVNGNNVTMYGLFVEHHEQYQTLWNGNWGRVYFYQSELPYDAPSQAVWSHNGVNGYASYKVADSVTSHQGYGLGVYGVFTSSTTKCFNAIETPTTSQQVNVHDMINVYITGNAGSEMTHIINGTGATLNSGVNTATANFLWASPAFSISSAASDAGISISIPTESWHTYQVQYKENLTDPTWLSLGGVTNGIDTLATVTDSTTDSNRFYRVMAH